MEGRIFDILEMRRGVHHTAELVRNGQYESATQSWENVSQVVSKLSNQVVSTIPFSCSLFP